MFLSKGLNADCISLISDFAGIKENWKHRFSTDVLTLIEVGWVEVGVYNEVPCANCYMYSNTEFCEDGLCLNCADDQVEETELVNFELMKRFSTYKWLHTFETFKRRKDVYMNSFIQISQADIQNSTLFRKIQMYSLV